MKGLLQEYDRIYGQRKRVKSHFNNQPTSAFVILMVLWKNQNRKYSQYDIAEIGERDLNIVKAPSRIRTVCHELAAEGVIQSFKCKKTNSMKYKALMCQHDVQFYNERPSPKKARFREDG